MRNGKVINLRGSNGLWIGSWALLTINTSARSEEAPAASQSKVQGLFLSSEKGCADRRKAVCEKPCKQWANGQPDLQYSYDHCVQTCSGQLAFCR
jgi:hypothetical protein